MTDQPSNPLMDALKVRIPGETFRLPSQGMFYTNGELDNDVINGEVHVFPLTAIDEIIMKTPDMLLSGKAIEEVFARCIPQVKRPRDLLSKDVDYLLMCLRLISYGESLTMTYAHNCANAKQHNYDVELRPLVAKARAIDPTSLASVYTVTLPSEQVVKLRPPLYGSVMQLYLANFESANADEDIMVAQSRLLDIISDTIVSVDNITNRDHIREWIKALPAGWMKQLGDAMEKISDWGPSTSMEAVCKDCGEKIEIEIPLNPVAFFS